MTLLERLLPQFHPTLSEDGEYPITKREVLEVLKNNKFFSDLTISECCSICQIIHKKPFIEIGQILELFSMDHSQ